MEVCASILLLYFNCFNSLYNFLGSFVKPSHSPFKSTLVYFLISSAGTLDTLIILLTSIPLNTGIWLFIMTVTLPINDKLLTNPTLWPSGVSTSHIKPTDVGW